MECGNSVGISRLLKQIEAEGLSGMSLKSRPATRDFARENVSRLRQMQITNNKTTDKQRTARKSNYKDVPSKVAAYIKNDARKPESTNKSKSQIEVKSVSSASASIKAPLALSGGTTNNCPGEIPKYLTARKLEWQKAKEEEEKIALASCGPPGHVLLKEDERLAMLESLETDVAAQYNELSTLPLTVRTLKMKKRKEEIEGKILELEEAIAVFSKPKVFIRKRD